MWLRILVLIVFCSLASGTAFAQEPSTYEELVQRVKKSDQTVDFQQLRFAYAETKLYSPYGGDRVGRKAMFAALNAREFEAALKHSEKALETNYLDMNAHFVAFAAQKELGKTDKSDYHKFVFQGLIKSISDSGDGKSPATAFVVISTDEEYVWLNYMGLTVKSQALVEEKGHRYDMMTSINPKTGQTVVYYFNVDKPLKWLSRSLGK